MSTFYEDRKAYYEKMLENPFPLTVSDIKDVIWDDSYNLHVNGALTFEELQTIRKEVLK